MACYGMPLSAHDVWWTKKIYFPVWLRLRWSRPLVEIFFSWWDCPTANMFLLENDLLLLTGQFLPPQARKKVAAANLILDWTGWCMSCCGGISSGIQYSPLSWYHTTKVSTLRYYYEIDYLDSTFCYLQSPRYLISARVGSRIFFVPELLIRMFCLWFFQIHYQEIQWC